MFVDSSSRFLPGKVEAIEMMTSKELKRAREREVFKRVVNPGVFQSHKRMCLIGSLKHKYRLLISQALPRHLPHLCCNKRKREYRRKRRFELI